MTSLPIVPSKFYQVCRLCLTVVNDTNDLMNLSVFGRHDATCMDKTASAQPTGNNACVPMSTSTPNSGVIVKAAKSMSRKSSISGERDTDRQSVGDASSSTSDNEAASADDAVDDDEQTILNNNNNNNLQQSEILERIYTFLSITVSAFTRIILVVVVFFLYLFL